MTILFLLYNLRVQEYNVRDIMCRSHSIIYYQISTFKYYRIIEYNTIVPTNGFLKAQFWSKYHMKTNSVHILVDLE